MQPFRHKALKMMTKAASTTPRKKNHPDKTLG
jgi:hypothetical protein